MKAVWVILNQKSVGVLSTRVFGVYASFEAARRALKTAPLGCWIDSPDDGDPIEE